MQARLVARKNTFRLMLTGIVTLALVFLGFAPGMNQAAVADVSNTATADWTKTDPDSNGLNVSKYVSANDDGSYQVTLEQWLDGVRSAEPVDVVMVLDVSGSMSDTFYDALEADQLDTSKIYYVNLSSSGYVPVSYCETCGAWYRINTNFYDTAVEEHATYLNYYGYGYSSSSYHGYTQFTPKTSFSSGGYQFYELETGKLSNLKAAAKSFVSIVAAGAKAEGVDNRISLVKFADNMNYAVGNNSCSFSCATTSGYSSGNCTQVVAPMQNAEDNEAALDAAIDSLYALGSTRTDYAMQMAQWVLEADNTDHRQVVVLFTDGEPQNETGDLSLDWDSLDTQVANSAIATSAQLKASGVDVFTVGLLEGLDDSVPATSGTPATTKEKNSRFLTALSSNYPQASSMTSLGAMTDVTNDTRYFYETDQSTDLTTIFERIANRTIEMARMSLGPTARVVDDVTQYFDVDVDSVSCATRAFDGTTFSQTLVPVSLDVSITQGQDESTRLEVSGYDFCSHYCMGEQKEDGTHGEKLVVSFRITPKDDFLGGNAVPTNLSSSGIYEADGTCQDAYPEPTVNVTLSQLAVTVADANVYALDSVTLPELLAQGRFSYVGRTSGETYALTPASDGSIALDWQDDFAQLSVATTDATGAQLAQTGMVTLAQDASFELQLTATPCFDPAVASSGSLVAPNRNPGSAAAEVAVQNQGLVRVFDPVVTFKDAQVSFGQLRPDGMFFDTYDSEPTKTTWSHPVAGSSSNVTMLHPEPALTFTYEPSATAFLLDHVATLADIPVAVEVTRDAGDLTALASFVHHDCNTVDALVWQTCSWQQSATSATAFLLHVSASDLLPQAGTFADWWWLPTGLIFLLVACLMGLVHSFRAGGRGSRKQR